MAGTLLMVAVMASPIRVASVIPPGYSQANQAQKVDLSVDVNDGGWGAQAREGPDGGGGGGGGGGGCTIARERLCGPNDVDDVMIVDGTGT